MRAAAGAAAGAKEGLGPVAGWLDWFEREGNPLYLWAAWRLCRANGVPVPEVMLAYLDRVAAALQALADGPEPLPERVGPALQKALGFQGGGKGGRGSEFSRYRDKARDIHLALEVELKRAEGMSLEEAVGHTADVSGTVPGGAGPVSESTVRRARKALAPRKPGTAAGPA